MMKTLTEKQKNMLDFIEEFQERENMAPTVYEIADYFGIKTSTVFAHLRALQRKKQLTRTSKARSIALLRTRLTPRAFSGIFFIPLLGRVNAGLPAESIAYREGDIAIGPELVQTYPRETLFALKVQGESMRDIGMYDGDTVIIAQGAAVRPGDIVVALVNGDVTVKTYFLNRNGKIELHPANKDFQIQVYLPNQVTIQGKVVALQRHY